MREAIEGMLAARIWERSVRAAGSRIGLYAALGLAGCFVASHLVFAWAEARYYMPVTAFTRYLPLYYPLNARHTQLKLGLLDRSQAHEQAVVSSLRRPPDGVLNYPLAPLTCAPRVPLLNVLYVVIDAMRADALTPELAPRMAKFAGAPSGSTGTTAGAMRRGRGCSRSSTAFPPRTGTPSPTRCGPPW
jgi:membrane-anchored protein YejM (alkaline phosphatase superfamily)